MELNIEDFDQLAADVNKKLNMVINDINDKLQNIHDLFYSSIKNIKDNFDKLNTDVNNRIEFFF